MALLLSRRMVAFAAVLLLLAPVGATLARPADMEEYAERARNAAEVLRDLQKTPDKGIPQDLLERAHGIAVIPHVVKAAFGIGGRWGKGLVAAKTGGSWGTPAFVEISGGSFGFQLGGQAADVVLVFATEKSLKSLLESKVKLGADASISAGPIGRSAEIGTDAKLNAEIYSYSRSKGLFAGIALDGAVISIDDSANRKVYGREVSGKDIVLASVVKPTAITMPFVEALRAVPSRVSERRR